MSEMGAGACNVRCKLEFCKLNGSREANSFDALSLPATSRVTKSQFEIAALAKVFRNRQVEKEGKIKSEKRKKAS